MRYQIVELLGSGGMGRVYKARDPQLDREVALKLLRGRDPMQVRRMVREARAQARVSHESVCEVYEAGETPDGQTFIAMRHVDGESLVAAAARMDLDEKIAVMRRVADAVQAAHSQGLVHRDLKPANVMVERREDGSWHPYVLDFGLAVETAEPALTTVGNLVGTPAYMAPEQVEGPRESLDRRTDVYSLGAILFELLAGRPPFEGETTLEVLVQVAEKDPPALERLAPQVPRELATVVGKCLQKDPAKRYASARLLAEDLERFLRGEPVLAQAPSFAYRAARRLRRYRLALGVGAVAVLLGVAGGVKYTLDLERQRQQAVEARQRAESSRAEAEEVTDFLVQLFELADPHQTGGREIDARTLLARGDAQIEELTDRPLVQARLQYTMGEVYSNLGLYPEGESLLGAAAETRGLLLAEDDPRHVDALLRLAQLHRRSGRLEESEAVLRRALVLHGGRHGLGDARAADILTRLAVLLRKRNQVAVSETLLRHSVAIYDALDTPGSDTPGSVPPLGLAHTLNSLAILHKDLGRFEEAEALYRRALDIRRSHLGEDHARTVVILGNLAALYSDTGRHEEAIELQRRALAAKERIYGPDHPFLAHNLNNLAASLWDHQGETEEVGTLLRRSLEIQEQSLGPEHPLVGIALGNLGELHAGRGELEEAEALYRRSLVVKEAAHGPRHHRTAYTLLGLANVLRDQGRLDEAETLYRRTLEIRRRALEPDHPELLATTEAYAELLRRSGRADEAAELLRGTKAQSASVPPR